MRTFTSKTDRDGEEAFVNEPGHYAPTGTVAVVGGALSARSVASAREAFLDREDAVGIISTLTDLVQVHDDAEWTAQFSADVATARALEIGTRVQISDDPRFERDGRPATYGDIYAGKVGFVAAKLDTHAYLGVPCGRVIVNVPGVVNGAGGTATDIHVSSLEVLPTLKFGVGDRVQVAGWDRDTECWDGPATVATVHNSEGAYSVDSDNGMKGYFAAKFISDLPTPDYAAKAAEFKPGDMVLISDNPGTGAQPGSGYVASSAAGRAGNVTMAADRVTLYVSYLGANGKRGAQIIHVAHLTRAKAVPA